MTAPEDPRVLILEPKYVIDTIEHVGIKKVRLPLRKMILLALLAGFYAGFGGTLYIVLTSEAHDPLTKLVGGIGFSTGLVFIVFIGAELFTGNCMTLLAVLRGDIRLWEMLYDLSVVWWFNFLGGVIMASAFFGAGIAGYDATAAAGSREALTAIGTRCCVLAKTKAELGAWEIFFRGIMANMLVCLAILVALASRTPSGKVLGCIMPIMAFVVLGMEHCIANQFLFAYATMLKCPITNHGYYWLNLLLSTIGNMLGAFTLAVMYFLIHLFHQEHQQLEREAAATQGGGESATKQQQLAAEPSIVSTQPVDEELQQRQSTKKDESAMEAAGSIRDIKV